MHVPACAGEPSLSQGGSSWGGGDWAGKCGDILTAVQQHLGTAAGIFNAPVDTAVYTDYPNHVSHPMDMGTIRQRLDRREYSNPQEFCSVRAPTSASQLLTACSCVLACSSFLAARRPVRNVC